MDFGLRIPQPLGILADDLAEPAWSVGSRPARNAVRMTEDR